MAQSTIRKPWPRAWTWAIGLAVLLFGAHATTRWWGRWLFGDVPTPADAPPAVVALMVGWLILSVILGTVTGLLISEGSHARWRARWQQEEAERQRLHEICDRLYLESLPDWQREAILRSRQEAAARETRARAILDAEWRAARDGERRPQEDSHENRLL